jgi:hypothetical protein
MFLAGPGGTETGIKNRTSKIKIKVTSEWSAPLLLVRESDLNLGPETGCLDGLFS